MLRPLTDHADAAGRWATVALAATIPVSVVLDNVLMGVIAILWLLGGNLRDKLAVVRANPVALAALVLFALLLLGLAYGTRDVSDLGKYVDLLLLPVFLTYFQDAATRRRAWWLFSGVVLASIVISLLASRGVLVDNPLLPRTAEYPPAFKSTITQSLLVAFAAYLFALLARENISRPRRALLVLCVLFAVHNVIFTIYGRTGYVVLAALFVYYFAVTFGRRGLVAIALLGALTFYAAYRTSDTFHERMRLAAEEALAWKPGQPASTSVGMRLEFYANTLKIIREHPLIGSGTGSFPGVYARAVEGSGMAATDNPHNEYLLVAVQIGLVGLAAMLYLFYQQLRQSARLPSALYRDLARGLVITYAIGCLFNSLLLDHTEGLLFAWLSALIFAPLPSAQGVAAKSGT